MYSEGLRDFMEMIMILCFTPPMELKTKLENIQAKATGRYLPVYEKVVSGVLTMNMINKYDYNSNPTFMEFGLYNKGFSCCLIQYLGVV